MATTGSPYEGFQIMLDLKQEELMREVKLNNTLVEQNTKLELLLLAIVEKPSSRSLMTAQ